jgi:2-dehydro-3-deoxygluconokinase
MPRLVKYCNLIMGNVWAAESLLGIPVSKNLQNIDTKEAYLNEAQKSAGKHNGAVPQLQSSCQYL